MLVGKAQGEPEKHRGRIAEFHVVDGRGAVIDREQHAPAEARSCDGRRITAVASEDLQHVLTLHDASATCKEWRGNSTATGRRSPRTVSCASRTNNGACSPLIAIT